MQHMSEKMQKIMLAGQGVFLVLALLSLGMSFTAIKKTSEPATEITGEQQEAKNTQIFNLSEDIVSNIKAEGSKTHIANIAVNLAINEDAKDFKEIMEILPTKEPVIRNEVIQLLREHTFVELSQATAQEQIGKEIERRINDLLQTNSIVDVYFSKFFVQ